MAVVFLIAERLHKSIEEVLNLSEAEIVGWLAYFKFKRDNDYG